MAKYKIAFKLSAQKELNALPKQEIKRIINRIQKLESNPRPNGCEKLSGQELYRIRQGNYRIVYSIYDEEVQISIIKISHRKDVYRDLINR
ncbi:type II toxin-antitoxin system RelE/ParE family toxin [soil metagenome]